MKEVLKFLEDLASQNIKLAVEAGELNCYVHKGMLTREIKEGIHRFKPEIVELLRQRSVPDVSTRQEPSALEVRPAHEVPPVLEAPKAFEASHSLATEFPLAVGQKGLYVLQQTHPDMGAYNLPLCLRIVGDLDVSMLQAAWDSVLDQYPLLTARIVERDGTLWHALSHECRTVVQRHALPAPDDRTLADFLQKRSKAPFDLTRGPLTRVDLIARGERGFILLLTIHHIVFDGTSAVILIRFLFSRYRELCGGDAAALAGAPRGYQQFVEWETALLASPKAARHAAYWREQLAGELTKFELLPDGPRAASPRFAGRTLIEELPEALCRGVFELSKTHSVAPSVVFLAAFQLLLHKYTNANDVIVGMPFVGRAAQRFADEVGYFINMLPIRRRFGGPLKLVDFVHGVRGTMLDGLYHAAYPFPLMVEAVRGRTMETDPIYQVYYGYQDFLVMKATHIPLPGDRSLDVEVVPGVLQEGDSDLGLEVFRSEASFAVHIRYRTDLHAPDQMKTLFERYCLLLEAMCRNEGDNVHEYPIISESERRRVLDFNPAPSDYPRDLCIHDLFVAQVRCSPDRIAVVFGDQRLSYQELHDQSLALAAYLQSLGVGPDSIVGLCLKRSNEMMIAILGTVLAGGAYLPLDPDYPDERLAYMVQDSSVAVVLTQESLRERIGSLLPAASRVLAMDSGWPRDSATAPGGGDRRAEVTSRNLCYVIYTSGSTGRPKGVLVEHRALVNRLHWMQKAYPLGQDDVVLQKTPYSFDVSVWEFFWPMITGASVVFAVPDGHMDVDYLGTLIDKAKVTTLHFVPPMLATFLDHGSRCPGVRQVFCSGEALGRTSVDRYRTRFPNASLHNLYGPTEAAIDVTAFDCSHLDSPLIPIGAPIDNIQIYILDAGNNLQPVGIPGELHIAGDGLARGYLNRPELTAERFAPNPFIPGARMYRTGDLARWRADGNIEYLGRMDTQVKIRGFRIELGEIEARLNEHPDIDESVVIAHGPADAKQLVAFYRAGVSRKDQLTEVAADDLRGHLRRFLPVHMLPAAFVSVESIPLTASGKVDRRALAQRDLAMASTRDYVAPRDADEERLAAVWAEVLNLDAGRIGVDDGFFELGGHSLLATQLVSKIRSELGVGLPLKSLFDASTLGAMAEVVRAIRLQDVQPPDVEAADEGFEYLAL